MGATSLPQAIKLTNTAQTAFSISSIKITGANVTDFAETNTCGAMLAGGASCAIKVTFTPGATGARSASLVVTDSLGRSQAPLSGTGATLAAGTLTVTVSGLPIGTNAAVTVTGINSGHQYTVTQTTTVQNLVPDTYTSVASIVRYTTPPNTVYVPSVNGSPTLVTSTGGAAATVTYSKLVPNWKAMGPSAIGGIDGGIPAAGKLSSFAVSNTNPSLMFAAGGPENEAEPYTEAGVYKTTNGGATWTQQNRGLTDPAVNALWLDQANTNFLLAGTNASGIFRSANGAATWRVTSFHVPTYAFLQIGSAVYAATEQGIASSTYPFTTWNWVVQTSSPVRSLAAQGGSIYAGLDNGQVMIQATPTSSWKTVTPAPGIAWSIAVNPSNPLNAFVVEWNWYASPDLYLTNDGGQNWGYLSNLPSCGVPDCPVQVRFRP